MRKHSKTIIATGAASLMLLGLTACGPTAVEEDPTDVTPGVEQPEQPTQPEQPAPGDDTPLPGDDDANTPGDDMGDDADQQPGTPDDEETPAP